ncbi:hypothetical protein [Chitiniphilus eburneus]|uniref:Uncharacterized protein n=1 Tax=Chitiniphilus eburneus TaxID=2571148 RepID=A0A4U0Q4X9_9NEIS|nr:hypothetical protein [Chitiniphilus eburneus]TJZ76213.1 hypothetical protein FAZ21_05405 [Chitiniphilus eburneus]
MTNRPPAPPPLIGYSERLPARALADPAPAADPAAPPAKPPATETLASRTGALVNEIDFPGFVSQLVNGTFDAIVDAAIRQMESYSSLVSAVAKTVDQFTEENITPNQARDWLAQRYAGEVAISLPTAEQPTPQLVPRAEGLSPQWLADYGVAGEEMTTELLEKRVLPRVRLAVGAERQQLLAAMVTLGINRIAVRDGSITAKVMFRATAQDSAKVNYAAGSDPAQQSTGWGQRGSNTYSGGNTMVSTLGVNAQNDTNLRADLFGEVKLNFVSETLPLDKLADAAKMALVQRNLPGMQSLNAPPLPAAPQPPAAPAAPVPDAGGR